jgi:hypothetical protein
MSRSTGSAHDGYARLVELLSPVTAVLARTGAIPYPNPIGVTAPTD